MKASSLPKLTAMLLATVLTASAARAAVPVGDEPAVREAGAEAVRLLGDYLRVDTTNPPGNEKLGAEFLASVFSDNGIEAKVLPTAPERACLYARLKGTGKKRPIVLLSHIDVVPAQAEQWRHPPFQGEIHDEEIWGRGALDMKGMAIAELEAMLLIKRSGRTPERDIIFLATPDEEVGGQYGARWFVEKHPELIGDAEFLINEGFHIDAGADGKARYWGVDVAEKSVLWLRLSAQGAAGHASMPISDAATNRLVKALSAVLSAPPRPIVLPAVRDYFRQISRTESGWLKAAYENIDESVKDRQLFQRLLADKMRSSMLINTASLTVLKAGYKTNVIPAEATAELDCRLLPGTSHEAFIGEIKEKINDPEVKISVLEWEKAGTSPFDNELTAAIKAVAEEESPGIAVVPVVVPWFTDAHWFREKGIACYGFEPFEVDQEHIATVHGNDERIPIKVLTAGVRRLYKILSKVAF